MLYSEISIFFLQLPNYMLVYEQTRNAQVWARSGRAGQGSNLYQLGDENVRLASVVDETCSRGWGEVTGLRGRV